MKSKRTQLNEVVNIIEEWRPRLFLNEWRIDVEVKNENLSHFHGVGEGDVAAKTHCDTVYKNATITIYPCFFENGKEYREEMIVHELIHLLVQPAAKIMLEMRDGLVAYRSEIDECVEELTQRFARIVVGL